MPRDFTRRRAPVLAALAAVVLAGCELGDLGRGYGLGGLQAPSGDTVVAVPFAVSDAFTPSGYFGDAALPHALVADVDGAGCLAPRPPDAQGSCYRFTFHLPDGATSMGFFGVYWQTPPGNFGDHPGQRVAPGATRATAAVAVDAAGTRLAFRVGGLGQGIDPATRMPYPYADDLVAASAPVVPTPAFTAYTVPFPTRPVYDRVLGAFSFSVTTNGARDVTVWIDDVWWQP